MKIVIILVLSLALFLSACDALLAPFQLIGELLPLAIKYAPYALMFLETPDDNIRLATIDGFNKEIEILSRDPSLKLSELTTEFPYQISQKKNLQYVIALHLDSLQKVEKIQKWLLTQQQYNISYIITAHNTNMPENLKNISNLVKNSNFIFLADGPLKELSNNQSVSICQALDTNTSNQ